MLCATQRVSKAVLADESAGLCQAHRAEKSLIVRPLELRACELDSSELETFCLPPPSPHPYKTTPQKVLFAIETFLAASLVLSATGVPAALFWPAILCKLLCESLLPLAEQCNAAAQKSPTAAVPGLLAPSQGGRVGCS